MADILVRDLDPKLVVRLKARAKRNRRSLQNEAKSILESAAGFSAQEAQAVAKRWQRSLSDRRFSNSSRLIREDRLR